MTEPTPAPDPRASGSLRAQVPLLVSALVAVLVAGSLVWAMADRSSSSAPAADGTTSTTAAGTATTTVPPDDDGATDAPLPAALADADWYPKFAADLEYANTWLGMFRQLGYTKLLDGGVPDMNIEDGHRRTWQPPDAGFPKLTVWIYGSAAVLGLAQRDDFTMASMLAKVAFEDGVELEVVNKGVPGDQYWLQADRFAWDVSGTEPPDAVIFYVGVSDINAAVALDQQRLGDRDWPDDLFAASFLSGEPIQELIDEELRGGEEQPPAPDGVSVATPEPAAELDPAGVGELATSRLGTALPMGLDIAERYDVAPFVFWEPMRLSRDLVEGEPTTPNDADLKVTIESAIASLPTGVIDLSRAFQGVDDPLYFDDLHHNEEGAAIAAAAIYDHLVPTIDAIIDGQGG